MAELSHTVRTILVALGGQINLCFHDIVDHPLPTDSYSVTPHLLEGVLEHLYDSGLTPFTRLYFDDNKDSFVKRVLPSTSVRDFADVCVAIPTSTIGANGCMDHTDLVHIADQGVTILPHGHDHVRLASYSEDGEMLATPSSGPYSSPVAPRATPLTENEVLFQLLEPADLLHAFQPHEFVLPYGCFNATTVGLNERWGLYSTLTTSDFAVDIGQQLRPRLLIEGGMTPEGVMRRVTAATIQTNT